MSIELVDPAKNYELKHPWLGATFIMRHMTPAIQEMIDKECIVQDGKGGFRYDVSRDRDIKTEQCVSGWKGIVSDGQEVECNAENKRKLPVGVIVWLVKEIEERAGLRITAEEKKS
jgi:hypothetical protein